MKLKLLAKKCGFSRIKQDKPNVTLDTPMEEPAFRRLRQGLPEHLRGRFIYQKGDGLISKVVIRGIGVLPVDKQIEQLIDWLEKMANQLALMEVN